MNLSPMVALEHLSVSSIAAMSEAFHPVGARAGSMEQCADGLVRYLFDNLSAAGAHPGCALIRFFKTHRYGDLESALQDSAQRFAPGLTLEENMKCLVLLATAGERPEWNSRQHSVGHKIIPLASPEVVARSPMISQLIAQLGIDIAAVLQPSDDLIVDVHERTYNVFYIADAKGSPFIPAQSEFVEPYGVKSVIGFGGVLASGDLFATILFTKAAVARPQAELFRLLAISMKTTLLRFDWGPVFAPQPGPMPVARRTT